MNPEKLSLRERVQLFLLRGGTRLLRTVDSLLGVQWGEHQIQQLAVRWSTQISEIDQAIVDLEEERNHVLSQVEALAIQSAAIYLGGRQMTHNKLSFDPSDPHDEEMLDATIELLVKQRLAEVETEQLNKGHYIYHVEPNWSSIRTYLARVAEHADQDVAGWLQEGLEFIDETMLAEAGS